MNANQTEEKKDTLYIRMFGSFSVRYNGKLIAGGSKASDSQSVNLLQILIHNRLRGVPRDQLEDLLFENRDIEDIHHALQSVIYNTKNKLKKSGLPNVNYIEQRKGVFYWTPDIPVVEDASVFEDLCRQADESMDVDEQLALLLDAAHSYGGEFLPSQTASIWAAREARRYKELFCRCVELAAAELSARQDYFQLEDLGLLAARIDPLADWEVLTMEALVSLGRYDEARQLYDDTVQLYLNEQGLRPSKKMMEQFDRLGSGLKHEHAALDVIQSDLSGANDRFQGGYLCGYPVFVGIYRMIERMLERGGQSVYLMLCTCIDGKGNPITEGPQYDELIKRMGDAVRRSVRRGDAMTQYGKSQYLVLLINTTHEDCRIIQKRINDRFIIGRQRSRIQYYVNSVFWTP